MKSDKHLQAFNQQTGSVTNSK